jgi:hypothetical protein
MNDVSPHYHILGSLKFEFSQFSTSLYGYWCLLDAYEKLVGLDFGINDYARFIQLE